MSDSAPAGTANDTASADLAERVAALEAENARLRSAGDPAPEAERPAGGRWRAFASATCIVVASILVPVSIVTAWARLQLVDEDSFVGTLAPLVDDEAVQDLVITEAMDAITSQVDFAQLTSDVFDGIADLGLGPRAVAALRLLEQPAADGLTSLVDRTLTTIVRSDAFSDVWATTVRGAHRALTVASTSDGGGIVVMTSDGVGIQLGPIVEQVKQRLTDQGVGIAGLIPAVDRTVIIGSGEGLSLVRTVYALAVAVGWWLPVLTLLLFGLGIVLARRRSSAVLGAGVGLAIGGAALGATLTIGATAVAMVAGDLGLSPSALDVIYRRLVESMSQSAWVLALVGAFVALLGWLMGRSRAAAGTRAAVHSLNASARTGLAARGLRTGGFGARLGEHRVLVRTLVAVAAVLWLFALRPLGFGDVVLVVIVATVVAWVLELLQRRSDEAAPIDPSADDDAFTGSIDAPEPPGEAAARSSL